MIYATIRLFQSSLGLTMRHTFSILIATMTLAASAAIAQVQDFKHYGNFKHMMQSGETKGQVFLSELPVAVGVWGVGALAGLKGEIIQIDGKLLVSLGTDSKGSVQPPKANDSAVLWASAKVTDWDSVKVPTDMTQAQFEAFVTQQAISRQIDLTQPFIFRVTGNYAHLVWHVVTGERPSGDAPQKNGHGASAASGGHAGHGGHTNDQAGMKLFRSPLSAGQLLGVYSGDQLEGLITHPGEKFHLHYIDNDLKVSGHVDQYTLKAGSVLLLPKVGQHAQQVSTQTIRLAK
jgi:alpha-acetolactate decarboxylase